MHLMAANRRGQVLLFSVVMLLAISVAVFTVVNVGRLVHGKIRLQTAADTAAKSAAVWKARTINQVAALNCGMIACEALTDAIATEPGFSDLQKAAWKKTFRVQSQSFAMLSGEILEKAPWQAAKDAYAAGFRTASGESMPMEVPEAGKLFPREDFGAMVFTKGRFPPEFGLCVKSSDGIKKAVSVFVNIFGEKNPTPAANPIQPCLPYIEWKRTYSLYSVAFRRNPHRLFGAMLDKIWNAPALCIAKADAYPAEAGAGEMGFYSPTWKAHLEKVSGEGIDLKEQLEFACRETGLPFWQGQKDFVASDAEGEAGNVLLH